MPVEIPQTGESPPTPFEALAVRTRARSRTTTHAHARVRPGVRRGSALTEAGAHVTMYAALLIFEGAALTEWLAPSMHTSCSLSAVASGTLSPRRWVVIILARHGRLAAVTPLHRASLGGVPLP
jgi:hypothetical protein